jgi:hypothetical protein
VVTPLVGLVSAGISSEENSPAHLITRTMEHTDDVLNYKVNLRTHVSIDPLTLEAIIIVSYASIDQLSNQDYPHTRPMLHMKQLFR